MVTAVPFSSTQFLKVYCHAVLSAAFAGVSTGIIMVSPATYFALSPKLSPSFMKETV